MFELIYFSQAKSNICAYDITAILEASKKYNLKYNITGCLLYHNHEFIQILEGEKQIVKELFAKICTNTNHSNVSILSEGEKTEREFKTWNMAYHNLGEGNLKEFGEKLFIENFIALSILAKKPTPTIQMFWYMAKQLLQEKEQ